MVATQEKSPSMHMLQGQWGDKKSNRQNRIPAHLDLYSSGEFSGAP